MKFSIIPLSWTVASVDASVSSIRLANRHLRSGDETQTLLKKSTPFRRRRHLDDAGEVNAVDGSYSISFGKCIDIKTKSEDLFNENFIDQVQNGNALSLKSYVLFYTCQDEYGYGCSEDDSDVYMVDLPTYLSVVGTKKVYQRNDYCGQCENYQEYCVSDVEYEYEISDDANMNDDADDQVEEEEQEDDNEDQMEENDDGEQMEEDEQQENDDQMEEEQEENEEQMEYEEEDEDEEENQEEEDGDDANEMEEEEDEEDQQDEGRKLKQQIDCSRCDELQCFDKYSDDDSVANAANNMEQIDEYVAEWIGEVANCKETDEYINGQPIYIGPICSEYEDTFEFGVFMDEDCTIYSKLASFQNIIEAEVKNYSVDVPGYAINSLKAAFYEPMTCESQEVDEADQDDDEEEKEMNDYCAQLFKGESINFDACVADEQQEDEGDDVYNWYSFDVETTDDIEGVCAKMVSFNGQYSNYYDSDSAGSIHSRDRNGNLLSGESTTLSPGAIVAIVLACIIVIGVAARILRPRKVKSPSLHEPVYYGNRIS